MVKLSHMNSIPLRQIKNFPRMKMVYFMMLAIDHRLLQYEHKLDHNDVQSYFKDQLNNLRLLAMDKQRFHVVHLH